MVPQDDSAQPPPPHISHAASGPGLGALPGFSAAITIPTFAMASGTAATPTPSITMARGAGSVSSVLPDTVGVGSLESLALPAKLIRKVWDLEYVDMHELLPDTWRYQEEDKCCHQRRGQRRGPVTDILLWTECYAAMVSILASRFPEKTPQFMAYLKTIVKAQRTFTGEGWVTYDSCYRRKAAITKSLDWGAVDFTLYNETFTGRAKALPRCRYCLSEHHTSADCALAPESPAVASTRPPAGRNSLQLCQLFNTRGGNRCNFNPCKFGHLCSECRGNHPLSSCQRARPPPVKIPRLDSPPHAYRAKK